MSEDNTQSETMLAEWSHIIEEDSVGDQAINLEITADEETRRALATRLDVIAVNAVVAKLKLSRTQGGLVVHIEGHFDADLTQKCVVTTEDINTKLSEELEAWYSNPEAAVSFTKAKKERSTKGHGEIQMAEEFEEPEEIIDGEIDLGELVTQHLSLSINPYPHGEGVHFEVGDDTPEAEGASVRKNPFAALKDWKAKITEGEH